MREIRGEYTQDIHIDMTTDARVKLLRMTSKTQRDRYEVRGYPPDLPADEYVYCGEFATFAEAQIEAAAFILEQPEQ